MMGMGNMDIAKIEAARRDGWRLRKNSGWKFCRRPAHDTASLHELTHAKNHDTGNHPRRPD